jgi:hypothetical protein
VNPFATLDTLYAHILRASPDLKRAAFWLVACRLYLDGAPALFARQFLQDYEGEAGYLLEDLSSLIHAPSHDDHTSPYQLYHKSLVDFLLDPKRSAEHGTSDTETFDQLSRRCLDLLKGKLSLTFMMMRL